LGKVIVFGSINIDYNILINDFAKPGETVLGKTYLKNPGGKGANQAIAASRLGARTMIFGSTGQDADAQMILGNLNKNKVDTSHVQQLQHINTGTAFISLSNSGENSIIVIPGANGEFLVDDRMSDIITKLLKPGDIIVSQLEVPVDAVTKIGKIALQTGSFFLLNAAPATQLSDELMDLVNLLVVNELELSTIIDRDLTSLEEIENACRQLTNGKREIVVTVGSSGCFVGTNDGVRHFDALKVNAVDTTGAGDTFVGCLAAMLAEGKSLFSAVLYSIVASGLATTKIGAQSGVPTRQEVDLITRELLSKHPRASAGNI
jgi:ribokinase